MNNDELYMERCVELARQGIGYVAPNPMVGSVLVYDKRIIGEGYHRQYGQAHAEVNCIADAAIRYSAGTENPDDAFSELLKKSTMYVSLEPCAHFGKTPPCAELIISKKIKNVVIGCRDPFEQVNGKGIEKLVAAGINIKLGIHEASCKDLNKRFFTFHTYHRPYIILKWAQTANLKIGSHDSSRVIITNDLTNRVVHKWRSEEASILVGTNTAMFDNPSLTNRLWSGNHPTRLVVDMNLRLPRFLNVFDQTVKTIIFNTQKNEDNDNLVFYKIKSGLPLAKQICEALYQLNIQSVLVEGGAQLIQSFLDENIWDEARIITNDDLTIDKGIAAPSLIAATLEEKKKIISDTIRIYKPAVVV